VLLTCSYLTKILRNWRKCEWRVWIRWLPNVWSLKSPGESALLSTCTVTDDTPTKSSVNLQKDPSCGVFCEPFSNIEIGVTNCQVPNILIQNVRILLILSSRAWEWQDIWCSKNNYCIYLTWPAGFITCTSYALNGVQCPCPTKFTIPGFHLHTLFKVRSININF
jgi:hypothetical protein